MLLGLASGNTFLDPSDKQTSGKISTVSPEISAVAKQAFYDFGERPIWTERAMYGTGAIFFIFEICWHCCNERLRQRRTRVPPFSVVDEKDSHSILHGLSGHSGNPK